MDCAGRCEQVACGADVDISPFVECEVGARQRAVISLAHVPNRDVRLDVGCDQPTEELAGAVGRIGGQTIGVQAQFPFGPLDHCLRRSNLIIGSGRSGLHIDDDRVLDIN